MAAYLPRYLIKYLSLLYQEFSFNEFHFRDAVRVLNLDVGYAGQVLSRLVDAGWIAKKRNPSDLRKKTYRINNVTFDEIMRDIGEGADGEE
jgi:DNA-binding MarR family transcriptional regulator